MSFLRRIIGADPSQNGYETAQIGAQEQSVEDTPGVLLRVEPHAESEGINDMAGVLQSVHDVSTDLLGRNVSPHHSFELWFDGESIKFHFHAANDLAADNFRRRVGSNYSNSQIYELEGGDGFPSIPEGYEVAGARLDTERHPYYPIRHHEDNEGFDSDPYSEVTSEMLSTEDARVVVQVVFRPVGKGWTDADGILGRGESVDDVAESLRDGEVKGWINPRITDASSKDKAAAQIVEQQRGSQAFSANIRVLAASPESLEAESRARGVASMFTRYYNSDTEQGFEDNPVSGESALRKLVEDMHNRRFRDDVGDMTLTVDELASAAHIPNADIETPRIDWRHQQSGGRVPAESSRDDAF